MPAVNFSPIFNGWQGFTPTGLPLNGGFVYTCIAGSNTPLPTYTTNIGNVANSNPIQLLADGRPPQELWLDASTSYKFILTDSLLNPIGTYDNITGIDNSVPELLSEWVSPGFTPVYVNPTTFTLASNQTAIFQVGRRVRYTLGSGQYTGSIVSSVFAAVTTVVLVTDSIPLDNTLSAVDYSFLDALKPGVPTAFKSAVTAPSVTTTGGITAGTQILSAAQPGFSAYTTAAFNIGQSSTPIDVIYGTEEYDNGGCYNAATGVFTAPVAGRYQVNFAICPSYAAGSAAGVTMSAIMLKNGLSFSGRASLIHAKTIAGAVTQIGPSLMYSNVFRLNANDTLKWQAAFSDAVSIQCSTLPAIFSVELLG